jgi:O-methyltransferase
MRPEWSPASLLSPATAAEMEIYWKVQPYTMTSPERVIAAIRAVDYIVAHGIGGDIVECGVWRGGSMMAIAYALLRQGKADRTLYLYDTFCGMSAPTPRDVQFDGAPADALLASSARDTHLWGVAPLDEVRRNLAATGYPVDEMRFVVGPVEETIPRTTPESIAILRLDTDWYESTHHELVHLYPLLSESGILIVDDYGHWRGSQEATDEYFARIDSRPDLHRIDYTGVLAVKTGPPVAVGR